MSDIKSAFAQQAEWCAKLGSNFTAQLLLCVVETLDETTATGHRVLNWPGTAGPMKDVLPLRLSGALHALTLDGLVPHLGSLYPPNPTPTDTQLIAALRDVIITHDSKISTFLNHAPQTNEVARASILIAGLSVIQSRFDLPLSLFEIGASGGMNLNLDRFHHTLGRTTHGDANSAVKLTPIWTGIAPQSRPKIIARAGCDLNPIDVTDPPSATRLLSYIWPDQPERLSRTRDAIATTQAHPPKLDAADAADWVEALAHQNPIPGQTRVLMHSIAWQYMPTDVQNRITRTMLDLGQTATRQTPLAWLSFEMNQDAQAQLTLRSWPYNPEPKILANSDPHVKSIDWHS